MVFFADQPSSLPAVQQSGFGGSWYLYIKIGNCQIFVWERSTTLSRLWTFGLPAAAAYFSYIETKFMI
jgi:hypothetical protein